MFIGHFAVALAAKPAAPAASLGTLFIACELVDLAWPVFLLIGLEQVEIRPGITAFTPLDFVHYPWTHSLAMVLVWSVAAALLYLALRRNARVALVLGLVVLSHWFLDFLVHRPDLALAPGAQARFGLGIWNSVPATLLLEGALFGAALIFYLSRTRALDRVGSWGLAGLLIFLLAAYAGAAFGPPPPSVAAVAWAGLVGGALIVLLGYWVDRHRVMEA